LTAAQVAHIFQVHHFKPNPGHQKQNSKFQQKRTLQVILIISTMPKKEGKLKTKKTLPKKK
jgi:hypothetical protein